ncbi:MAG: ATP-dependent Clp protease ATP-binding subunit [Candidatus Uhrbacteria bacterium]|nr:ATP-dependent Clp protease ATP-binding subunit [Candidatus Uhrbacteria bacterium]
MLPIPPPISCQQCQSKQDANCRRCRGNHVIFSSGSVIFSWRHPFTSSHFLHIRTRKALQTSTDIPLFLFGFISFLAFVFFVLFPIAQSNSAPLSLFSSTHWSSKLFWVSLVLDLWLYSRIKRQGAIRPRVLSVEKEQEFSSRKKEHVIHIDAAFDASAHRALGDALSLAHSLKHRDLTPLHLFAVLFNYPLIQNAASRIAVDHTLLAKSTRAALSDGVSGTGIPTLTDDFYSLLMRAYRHAQDARKTSVDVLDLFTATIDHETKALEVMEELGVDPKKIEHVVLWFNQQKAFRQELAQIRGTAALRPRADIDRAMTGRATHLLNQYGNALTRAAQRGALFPPIGQNDLIDSLLATVSSTSKNILLVGNTGTGKSSLISGVAYRMVGERVPDRLKDKRLVSISAGHLAGAANPAGVFQELLDEVLESGNIALVINNLHDFTESKGLAGFDLASILAETIERTGLIVFATSTPQEYHRFLEGHLIASLFQHVEVFEPDEDKTTLIVESHIPSFEHRYGVYFTYDAIAQAVMLSSRYLHDTYNPKKSIDLCEQVALDAHALAKKQRVFIAPDHIARTLERITNAKVGTVGQDERNVLVHLEDTIHQRMINQEVAVTAVANALRRARMELREKKRPVAVFLFLGPTGVGKTELAKTLADVYFGSQDNMIRLDMSEYQELNSIERLIGLTGSDVRGGSLTEPVRKNPFSLILLDELEKANRDVLNLFLQVFEDGRVTDNAGQVIDFTNTIIIATSNAGAQYIQESLRNNTRINEVKTRLLEQELKNYYSPEFLNRFDDIIIFESLSQDHIRQIARLMIRHIQKQMSEKGIQLEVTDAALDELAREGFDPQFGARPLRRVIQKRIDDVLAKILLEQKVGRRDTVVLDVGGAFRIERTKKYST